MSRLDSDLEEGEIPDDSPSSPQIISKKSRELPRRYILRENKNAHKHRKECKHIVRYHAKKLAKVKKTPSRDAHKKHRKSCPRDKSHKVNTKYDNPQSEHLIKHSHSFSKHSLIDEINSSLKGFLDKQSFNSNLTSTLTDLSETKNKPSTNENLSMFKTSENHIKCQLKNINDSLGDSRQFNELKIQKLDDSPNLEHFGINNQIKEAAFVSHGSPKAESEESEDEEELRRIALATFAKRKPVLEPSDKLCQSVESLPESSKNTDQFSPDRTSNLASDNYEVVDMEVDEDTENSVEILDEKLFVIDTKPSSKPDENTENNFTSVENIGNSSDDEFEADILRAELIGNMFRKRAVLEQLEEEKSNAIIIQKKVTVPQTDKIPSAYQKPKPNMHHKPLQSVRRVVRKNSVNKSVKLKRISPKPKPNNQVEKSPKRLVITLNGESSSEESDDAEENPVPENPVASIEALISDCRQKSNSDEKNTEVIKHVPKALSCLSKAQQEEYNSLVKILAEKKKLPLSQETFQHTNRTVRSPLSDLKLLEEKLLAFKETLKAKKDLMTNMSKDVDGKKRIYMKSKLTAQHLKEKYVAAEKVRRIKLDEWFKSCKNFEVLKKSVSSLESKIIQLQNLCSKLGLSAQEQIYNLPSLPTSNGQF